MKKKEVESMIKVVEPNLIPDHIKARLPILGFTAMRKKLCKSTCPYYAGRADKQPRCMLEHCYREDDAPEVFHPVLMEMFPYVKKMEATKDGPDPVEMYNRLLVMFFYELKEKALKKSSCYGCPYTVKDRPCVMCMKKIMAA